MDLTRKGVDVDLVRRFLGHASIATTQLYLRGRDRDRLGEALVVKDGLFGEVEGEEGEVSSLQVGGLLRRELVVQNL